MQPDILPFIYGVLVLIVISFLFVLLWRMFTNTKTIYFYDYDVITTVDKDYMIQIQNRIKERGSMGWKYEGCEREIYKSTRPEGDVNLIMLIFVKIDTKMKFF